MSDEKISSELRDKIAKTELPEIKIRCDRAGFYNQLRDNSTDSSDKGEAALRYSLSVNNIAALRDKLRAIIDDAAVIEKPLELSDKDIPQDMRNIGINIFRKLKVVDLRQELSETEKAYIETINNIVATSGMPIAELRKKSPALDQHLQNIEKISSIEIKKNEDVTKAIKYFYFVEKCTDSTEAAMYVHYPHCISVTDCVFVCKKDDAEAIAFAQGMAKNKQNKLIYNLFHELKHVKNALLLGHRPYASDYKEPTMEEKYHQGVEDERSSTFNSVNEVIKEYLKAGNYKDFSMFPGTMNWVVSKLKGKSDKEIKKLCYPPVKLLNETLQNWNRDYLDAYFN